jgi:hypothetical protein
LSRADGSIWRTGANAATTLTTDATLKIGDLTVPAGTYTLFTIPGPQEWTLILNKTTTAGGKPVWGAYDYEGPKKAEMEKAELGRTKMKRASHAPTEQFTINLDKKSEKEGTLVLMWEDYAVSAPVRVM